MKSFKNHCHDLWKIVGPVALSALSLFVCFFIIQSIAQFLIPGFDLLASKGLGKALFTTMAFVQLLLFVGTQSQELSSRCVASAIGFFTNPAWLITFGKFFAIFGTLHAVLLGLFVYAGYATYHPILHLIDLNQFGILIWSLFVTFMLAWTEESIFRAVIYQYFKQYYPLWTSILIAAFIFMLCHFLANPLVILGSEWRIALGLFLLGFLLNTVFAATGTLAASMGVHAGVVYIKVLQRKLPFLTYLPQNELPFWIDPDLRASLLVHALFALCALGIAIIYKKSLKKAHL